MMSALNLIEILPGVGHSEGALIIRQAMINACQRSDGRHPFLDAWRFRCAGLGDTGSATASPDRAYAGFQQCSNN
jgi:hypothetical protein